MGEAALVESQVADAIALVEQLDSEAHAPKLAVWYYYDDVDEWRLLVAGPHFDELLPKQEALAYRQLVDAMGRRQLSSLTLSAVKLLRTDSPLPLALKQLIGTGTTGTTRAHFIDTTLNGIFIKEMIVLRSA